MKQGKFILEGAIKMQWLNNSVLKGVQMNEANQSTSIVTILPVVATTKIASAPLPNEELSLKKRQKQAELAAKEKEAVRIAAELEKINHLREKILTGAKEEAERILQAAQVESQQMRETAYQEAFESGEKAGTEVGYQTGMEHAAVIARDLIQNAQENVEQLLAESQQYVQDKKEEWTKYSLLMAEALIKKQFELDEQTILSVLEPLWLEIEQPDQLLVIRTHPQHVAILKEKMEEKKKELMHFRYVILKEKDYSLYQVELESDAMLLTFDLQEELEQFLNQLKKDD